MTLFSIVPRSDGMKANFFISKVICQVNKILVHINILKSVMLMNRLRSPLIMETEMLSLCADDQVGTADIDSEEKRRMNRVGC